MNPDINSNNQQPIQPPDSVFPNQPVAPLVQSPVSAYPVDNNIQTTSPKKSRKRKILIIALIIIAVLVGLSILGRHIQKQVTTDTAAPLIKNTDLNDLASIDSECYALKLPKTYVLAPDTDLKTGCLLDTSETDTETSGVNNNATVLRSLADAKAQPFTLPTQSTGSVTLDQAYDYLKSNYFSQVGTVKDAKLPITLGGLKAYRTNFLGRQSKTLAIITAVPPKPYTINGRTRQFFIISLSTSADNGEQILQTMINSWQWR